MKEIKYDEDLYNNIRKSKKKIFPQILIQLILGFIVIALSAYMGANYIPYYAGLTFGIIGCGIVTIIGTDENTKQEVKKAIYKMNKDAGIEVSCEELQKANIVKQQRVYKKNDISTEEKIVKYFEFLDKKDQIQILKQVKTIIDKEEIDNELFLLEENDLEKEGLQYIKHKETR